MYTHLCTHRHFVLCKNTFFFLDILILCFWNGKGDFNIGSSNMPIPTEGAKWILKKMKFHDNCIQIIVSAAKRSVSVLSLKMSFMWQNDTDAEWWV